MAFKLRHLEKAIYNPKSAEAPRSNGSRMAYISDHTSNELQHPERAPASARLQENKLQQFQQLLPTAGNWQFPERLIHLDQWKLPQHVALQPSTPAGCKIHPARVLSTWHLRLEIRQNQTTTRLTPTRHNKTIPR
ncbi:hypothetical protein Nepgr_011583 [Nepenthes gracilis]|uniref:Uncharacterized protein n=1 Tax=Nepenthes gracilis TaxID=150966 RepID=A0AAD3SEP1_NEPGR|nr:hypothetical protein Nepgr_011583 [Nepenthes gracilis]